MNPLLNNLPEHLLPYTQSQNYDSYTAQNQAVWRYVMRINTHFLQQNAHSSYLEGLKKTGISVSHIPSLEEMNRCLSKIGWGAVTVDGFIPPNAFMEFQAYQVLVIAADIRNIDHISYTPAPDIIHEAAGHAPIIANPEYAEYLRRFGEIGCKAISSAKDFELYEAIRLLSILKEDPYTKPLAIAEAEEKVLQVQESIEELSEMAQIRNLHWWTVEYGLIGSLDHPKIYGAGLLSSIGESEACLKDSVKKIPYSIEAAQQNFDITKPQPQLFVTPDFAHLSYVLEAFANKMALRTGGLLGLQKLVESKELGSIELSTGLQISGVFTRVISDDSGKVLYVQTTGKTALAHHEKELIGHGIETHAEGFGSPVGKLKGINLAIEDMYPSDLEAYGIYEGKTCRLNFEGGVQVKGEVITGIRNLQGKIQLISFKNCTVTYREEILFRPEWGVYDMAVGKEVVSAFAGPADSASFHNFSPLPAEKTHQIAYSESDLQLHQLYQKVRTMRKKKSISIAVLQNVFEQVIKNNPEDWLLPLEIYELICNSNENEAFNERIFKHLESQKTSPERVKLIENGLILLSQNN